jgi:hypothetical protein
MTNSINNHPRWWDPYSVQPYKLSESEKPRTSAQNLLEYGKTAATNLLLSPIVVAKFLSLSKGTPKTIREIAGISISIDPEWQDAHIDLIEELGIKHLLIRIPSWHIDKLDQYLAYMSKFKGCDFVVNILQDRNVVEDLGLWKNQVQSIFDALSPIADTYKIGNAINRSKWGCSHSGQALELFLAADQIRRRDFPSIKLLGSSVIDFEPLITLRTLFNFYQYHYDGCAALMYINRRGSAYGRQYKYFDLEKKLKLTKAILSISNNTDNKLWITETNWPLLDTKPFTPNSGNPRSTVDENTQAEYLKQYLTIAANCGWVERVYWWQLINPGYGLVDHRENRIRKMPSYYAFKALLNNEN